MRVALIVRGGVEEASEERNNAPIFVHLIRRLAASADVRVVSLHGENRVTLASLYRSDASVHRFAGAEVVQLGTARMLALRVPTDLVRVAAALHATGRRSGRPEVIHGIGLSPGLTATFAGRLLGIPSVVSLIGGELTSLPEIDYGDLRTAKGRVIVKTLLRTAGTITVASRFMQERVERHGARARLMPFGIDAGRFAGPVDRTDGPPFRLLHVGTLCPLKDQLTLVESLRRLVERGLDFTLDVVGWDDWQGRVQLEAARLGVGQRIRFHGWMGQDGVVALCRSAHGFVMTSRDDVAPAAVLEAAAAGLPIVGTRVGFIADWAPDRAIATPIRDPGALADALQRVLTRRDERVRLGSQAQAWVFRHASLEANDAYLRLYAELAARGRAAAKSAPL